jgi:deoxyribodipyrimidine photo-lyase
MFNENLIKILKKGRVNNGLIIYAMVRDQRTEDNWALLFSQDLAIKQKQPPIVACPIAADYQDISQRQLNFMIQGLKQVGDKLDKMNIPFIVSSSLVESSLSSLVKRTRENNENKLASAGRRGSGFGIDKDLFDYLVWVK